MAMSFSEKAASNQATRSASNDSNADIRDGSSVRSVGFLLRRVDCNDGVASHCETLIRGLVNHGVKVVLLTGQVRYDSRTRARFDALNSLAVDWIHLHLPKSRFGVGLNAANQIVDAIRQHQIQLLHLHGLASLPLVRFAGLRAPTPVVVTAHPAGTRPPGPHGMTKLAVRLLQPLLRRALWPDRAIAYSSKVRDWYIQNVRIAPARVELIFNGIRLEHFYPPTEAQRREARAAFGADENDFVCSLVGRYEPSKGHELLLDAASHVGAADGGWRFLLVGAGDYEASIRSMISARGLDRSVQMLGYCEDLRTVYWASDAVVLPSMVEGFGLVTAESMACGAVPLRTPTGGAADQITHGADGFIFPFKDATALAGHLATLRDNPALRAEMGARAAETARNRFSDPLMVEKTLKLYEAAIADRRK